ncbi:MAG: thioredoxin domain-containing protein [Gammaproteobacteria bacterium]|nr:thioredoxin domain-containing protein [Gammaproteobacteria bacterium]NIR81999.1 thioredoxin domain-containing protein [Gammaproteobacteria bacterium]NIR89059.1 thioredoxin domain-containing protein [Gammaproteobacteria bacterium]NIU03106.1 thioredoxin domain-containing protein [Gammaproteobacteria bacterium]NIX84381.1 DUF255 domain-containing protein [Gammaproteobacteria bacterium]
MSRTSAGNALAGETSPYLLQHAHNPVEWCPWSEEALQRARSEDKPILLSIGYSACHWCHVMAHESFEDEGTARVMNELFVNIKVDREERPDLDKIYQIAHQLLTRRAGGWPLTMFLTPDDLTPFFGGTYFPMEPRFGMPAFKDILVRVAQLYREHHGDIKRQNASLQNALKSLEPRAGEHDVITPKPLDAARAQLEHEFDGRNGGFGSAPKFPHPTNIDRLLRHYAATGIAERSDDRALDMATFTLKRMALGGLYDQLGGGFCRYSVDEAWMIPHFEKMLYDNGPLLTLCAETWQLTRDPLFQRVTRETAEWALREMQSPEGGYYSTLDADSEGEEGKYYVWTRSEVRAVLSDDEYAVLTRRFGLDQAPNFEGRFWHLHAFADVEEIGRELDMKTERAQELLDTARRKLFRAREQRVRPGRDEKILTSWNGLMLKGMATAGCILDEPRFTASAENALGFVRNTLWRDGRLLATYKDGRAHLAAYLDDYAYLIDGILTLLQTRWRAEDLAFAVALADVLLEHFEDKDEGGFYFTADDHERLMHRPKPTMDDALPSGNGVAAFVLARLGHLLGDTRYLQAAERAIRLAWPMLTQIPHAHTAMLLAVEEYLEPPQTIVLRGEEQAMDAWRERCRSRYAPRRMTLAISVDEDALPGLLAERTPRGDGVVAYVCEGHRCGPPVTELSELESVLAGTEVPPATPRTTG